MKLDALIFGGGIAGLWILDELRRRGYQCLLVETETLGKGQSIAAQGIIHGGFKYTLNGILTDTAKAVSEMPSYWKDCFSGRQEPYLDHYPVFSEHCLLWSTPSTWSKITMLGAQLTLQTKPRKSEVKGPCEELPGHKGDVYLIDEPVVNIKRLLNNFAERNRGSVLKISNWKIDSAPKGDIKQIILQSPSAELRLEPDVAVFAAGEGNWLLRAGACLDPDVMQRRPLHMLMVRGKNLSHLYGHCLDGMKTKVTITSAETVGSVYAMRVWQIGGQVAVDGVGMSPTDLIRHGRKELLEAIPGLDLSDCEWATYQINRAEPKSSGRLPDDVFFKKEGKTITAWPTKMALAPRLANKLADSLADPGGYDPVDCTGWFHPEAARPPWETAEAWISI